MIAPPSLVLSHFLTFLSGVFSGCTSGCLLSRVYTSGMPLSRVYTSGCIYASLGVSEGVYMPPWVVRGCTTVGIPSLGV